MRWIFVSFILCASSFVWGQQCPYKVSGHVFDLHTRAPLAYVNVYIEGIESGVSTDDEGYFEIRDICLEEFDLVFSFVGYKKVIHHHDVHHNLPEIFLAPQDLLLPSIVVEADKLDDYLQSYTVNTLSGRELNEVNASNIADLASQFSGVSALQTGQNVAKPMIHGLHSNRVVIVNNGVRHEFQNWGQEHAPEIDPELAESVSVIKGAATVRYGPEALGGVLLLDGPSMSLHQEFSGQANLGFDLNGRALQGRVKMQQGGERVSWVAQGGYVLQGDKRAPDYMLTNTGKREWSLAGGIRYHQPKYDLRLMYSHFNQELAILRSSITGSLEDLGNAIESDRPLIIEPFSYEINNPRQQVAHDMLKVSGQYFGQNHTLDITYAFQLNNRQEFDVRRGTLNEIPSIDLKLFSHSLDVDWQHPNVGDWEGSIGMQWSFQDNKNQPGTNTVLFIPNYKNQRLGIYMNEMLTRGKNQFDFGVRFDYLGMDIRGREPDNTLFTNSLEFQNFTATVGWERTLNEKWKIRTNLGTAWRPPNVFELYVFGKHQATIEYGIFRYQRNEDGTIDTDVILDENDKPIDSEIGYKWVTTANYTKDNIDLEFTGYANYIANYIYSAPAGITVTVRGAFPFFVYDQTDAILAGVDGSFRLRHSNRLRSTGQVSFVYARDVQNHDYFVEIPPLRLNYGLEYSLSTQKDLRVRMNLTYLFNQFMYPEIIPVEEFLQDTPPTPEGNFDFLEAPEGAFLANVGLFKTGSRINYSLEVVNFFNQSYRLNTDSFRYFADQAGINVQARIQFKF